jgi:site-specific DNA recombinase
MSVFGGMSKGERNSVKIRVRSEMAAQAESEDPFLGSRATFAFPATWPNATPQSPPSRRAAR